VTTIAFMYNSRLQVCHAGNLLMRLNFPLYAVEYAAYTCAQEMSRPYPMSLPPDLLVRLSSQSHRLFLPQVSPKGEYIAICVANRKSP
jgi:hypothetical protein